MVFYRAWVIACCAVVLGACTIGIDPEDDQLLRDTYIRISAGDFESVENSLDASVQTPTTRQSLEQLQTLIHSAGTPCERSTAYVTTTNYAGTDGAGRHVTAQHQYLCSDGALFVEARLRARHGATLLIEHYIITPFDREAAEAARTFQLQGKPARSYAFLAATIASPTLMLVALFGVIFTRGFKRKWLWAIVSLVGLPQFVMDWGTGEIASRWLSINLVGYGIYRAGHLFAPWLLSFATPVGALVVLSLLYPRWLGRAPIDIDG
jgi:hypothetical protein